MNVINVNEYHPLDDIYNGCSWMKSSMIMLTLMLMTVMIVDFGIWDNFFEFISFK